MSSPSPEIIRTSGQPQRNGEAHSGGGDEAARLAALRRYDVLDTPPEEAFDRITRLTAAHFDVPIALVTLVDAARQWFKSCYGFDRRETSREVSFCAHALQQEAPTVVENATKDPRFSGNPLVTGEEHIRFYAGAPLVTPDGYALGTLCVLDTAPRVFGEQERARLEDLAAVAMDALEQRRRARTIERAEEALRRSEERHRTLVERSSDIMTILDPDGTVRYESPSIEAVLGRRPEELEGKNIFEEVHPEDRERVQARFSELLDASEVKSVEFRMRGAGDQWAYLQSLGRNLLGDAAVEGILVNSRDVTERKEAEAARRAARRETEDILESINDAFFALDEAWRFTYVNDEAERVLERRREDLLGQNVWEEFPEAVDSTFDEQYHRAVREQTRVQFEEYYLPLKRWFEVSAHPREEGGLLVFFRDINARKERRQALRESEARFRSVVENAQGVIFQTDAEGRWTLLSPSWETVTGYTVEESLGTSFMEYVHPEDRSDERMDFEAQAEGEEQAIRDDVRYRTKNGEARWMRFAARVTRDASGCVTGTTGTFSDVTDSLEVEAERAARKRAEELLAAKTTFLNNMSHELRTPLASIIGFAEVLEEEGDGEQREFAARIGSSGVRLKRTLESVLRLAQLDGQPADMELEPVPVAKEVRKAAAVHRPAAEAKGLTFEVSAAGEGTGEEASQVYLDVGAFHRIVDNLLSNAVKFTEAGGRVAVRVETDVQEVRISVEDTGIGISEDFQQSKLFEEFEQESKGLSRTHEGSGLGLAITQRLVEAMDGTIAVESVKGEGATFTVCFPRPAPESEEEAPAGKVPSEENDSSAKHAARLLVVEDNPNTRALANHVLGRDYDVTCVANAEEAFAQAQGGDTAFGALLIDINLGGGGEDGVGVLHRLRAGGLPAEAVPAVAFTAHAMPGDEEHYRNVGFEGYLAKPFSRAELLEAVEVALNGG